MNSEAAQLCATVQHNCDISDARYARDYSMCVYLLRMQEHYRWKHALALDAPIDRKSLGSWVRDTEDYWDTIEHTDFLPLSINNTAHDPFDDEAINHALASAGIAYSSGIGRLGQPHFVLAQCTARSTQPYPQLELGKELARDTITLPAMTRSNTIIVRHDSIKRMLWQMIAEWRLHRHDGPMARVIQHYDIDPDHASVNRITAAATDLSELLIHHERGEINTTQRLGSDYLRMLAALQGKPAEGMLRAVSDLMADSISTWPYLIEQQSSVHLYFWLAGLQGVRETLLEPTGFYKTLTNHHQPLNVLSSHLTREQQRWQRVAQGLLDVFNKKGSGFDVKATIEQSAYTADDA
ncbi:MAG: Sfum_1244 family protein [Pseudomonadota bacterium]